MGGGGGGETPSCNNPRVVFNDFPFDYVVQHDVNFSVTKLAIFTVRLGVSFRGLKEVA